MIFFLRFSMLFASLLLLTGCPVIERDVDLRYPAPDITAATKVNDTLCVAVPDASDFQIRMIMIYPRHVPPKERWYQENPGLTITDGQVCIPYSFYKFDQRLEYVVQVILWSNKKAQRTKYAGRQVISAFEIENGHAYRVVLEEREL